MNLLMDFLKQNGSIDQKNQKIVELGIRRIKAYMEEFLLIIIIAGVFKIILAGFIFQVDYILLRAYAGGYHAASVKKCECLSMISTIICLVFIRFANVNYVLLFLVCIISWLGIIIYAPIESVNKRLNINERYVFKRRARIIATVSLGFCCTYFFISIYILKALCMAMTAVFIGILMAVGLKKDNSEKYGR